MNTYPKNYKVKSFSEQEKILNEIFKFHDLNYELPIEKNRAKQSDGYFAIPNWKLIGKTYNEAVMNAMAKLKESRPFSDWRHGKWTEQYLRQLPIKEKFWNSQKEEIITIAAQTGELHKGKSVKKVREGLSEGELPLGIYEVLIILLTHPERLSDYNDLWIDCPGDEYSPDGDGSFSRAPGVRFDGGQVGAVAGGLGIAGVFFGSASGFVPQSILESRTLEPVESLTLDLAIKMVKDAGLKVIRTKTIEEEL